MGLPMARNLLRAGHQLTVFNRSRNKADSLASHGARVAHSPAAASQDAEAVMTMLSGDPAVEQVVFGENGVTRGLAAGALHVSCSTISIAMAKRLGEEHRRRGQGYLSALVFGRPETAQMGRLLVVAAGPPELIERARPAFEAIGRQTFNIGADPAQANLVKLCGNFMIASMLETFSEAYATLRKADIAPHAFLEVMNALFASPVYANYGALIADRKFEPAGFPLRLGLKDARLMLEAASHFAAPMPIASLIHDRLLAAMANGQADLDWLSVSEVSERDAGLGRHGAASSLVRDSSGAAGIPGGAS